jgi:hypothetical protein
VFDATSLGGQHRNVPCRVEAAGRGQGIPGPFACAPDGAQSPFASVRPAPPGHHRLGSGPSRVRPGISGDRSACSGFPTLAPIQSPRGSRRQRDPTNNDTCALPGLHVVGDQRKQPAQFDRGRLIEAGGRDLQECGSTLCPNKYSGVCRRGEGNESSCVLRRYPPKLLYD